MSPRTGNDENYDNKPYHKHKDAGKSLSHSSLLYAVVKDDCMSTSNNCKGDLSWTETQQDAKKSTVTPAETLTAH
eukprot:Awhi_evm1s9968